MIHSCRLRKIFLLLVLLLCVFVVFIVPGWGADDDSSPLTPHPSPPAAADTVAKLHFEYYGSTNCQRCHFNPIQ